jgi:hypothetical protein
MSAPVIDASAEEIQLAAKQLLVQAQLARDSLTDFFSFVMREELTQEPLRITPHQRVLLKFVWDHPRCVLRMPAGSSKTFCMAAVTLYLLGIDPTVRGAIVSETQEQAKKPLKMVADYIEQPRLSAMLNLAFPRLRRSQRARDPWTQTALTVERPPGIRDASLVAVGDDGKLPGSRLKWVIVDDIVSLENSATKAGRDKTHEFVDSKVISRMDPTGARVVVCNTPWHDDDLTYRLERAGWPTLTMSAEGNITLSNVPESWDTDDIRPSREPGEVYRLSVHDPDPGEVKGIWDLKFSPEILEDKRKAHMPHRYDQLFKCICRSDSDSRCQRAWIDKCKVPGLELVSRYEGQAMTVTGVDLGIGLEQKHDQTAFVTLELRPEGKRRILDVEIGRWKGPDIVAKIIRKQRQYNSIVRVENNAAQEYIRQFVLNENASVPVNAQTTGRNRANPHFGVESIFVELSNGAWEIPCDAAGRCHKHVQMLLDGLLYYEPPPKHTHDAVMAVWFAREQARALGDGLLLPQHSQAHGSLGMSLLAR